MCFVVHGLDLTYCDTPMEAGLEFPARSGWTRKIASEWLEHVTEYAEATEKFGVLIF